jgi:hypothetical protein
MINAVEEFSFSLMIIIQRYVSQWFGSVRFLSFRNRIVVDSISWWFRFDSIRFDSIRFDSIRFDSIRFDSIRFDSIRFDSIRIFIDSKSLKKWNWNFVY